MSKVRIDSSGVNRLLTKLERLDSPEFQARLVEKCVECAENASSTARGNVYKYITKETGETADSIQPYTALTDKGISFGISTNRLETIYHEMGTGPVGMEAGYPGEENLDQPIVYRSTGWSSRRNSEGVVVDGKNMGVPPKAFMHNTMEMEREEAGKLITKLIKEFLDG